MKKTQRLAAIGAFGVLTLSLGACSNGEEASTEAATTEAPATTEVETPEATTPEETTEAETPAAGDGVTETSDIFGPACDQVPTEGPGSAEGMVDAAVGTAASNNPLFKTLTAAVEAAGLGDTLNDTSAAYTVFGPIDSAFEELPEGTLDTLLADPSGDLTKILTYHVIPERYDAAGLVEAGTVASVQGGEVTIGGTEDAPTINDNEVLCGNIPTANATVFAIGSVLMPPA